MKKFAGRIILIVSLISLSSTLSLAQEEVSKQTELFNIFTSLRNSRAELLLKIPELEQELTEFKRKEVDIRYIGEDIVRDKIELEWLNKTKPLNQQQIKYLEANIKLDEEQLKGLKEMKLDEVIKTKKKELTDKRKSLLKVENEFNNLLNPELANQKFKWDISMVFSALVGLVIIGFFLIAWYDEKIRQAIFSGQAGIQFLTLFSLVIAIILFGITGILGAKELAALLGGISGYILGRVT